MLLAIAAAVATTAFAPSGPPVRASAAQVLSLADQARKQGQFAIAEEAYRALADDPNGEVRAEALFRHGKMLVEAGRPKDAAILFRQVVDARPDATAARLELARAL